MRKLLRMNWHRRVIIKTKEEEEEAVREVGESEAERPFRIVTMDMSWSDPPCPCVTITVGLLELNAFELKRAERSSTVALMLLSGTH